MTQADNWKAILIDGVVYEKHADGTLVPASNRMDFDKIDALTDQEIDRLAALDQDGLPAPDEDWAEALKNREKRLQTFAPKTRLG